MQQKITLIVHKPFVTFHWGKAVFAGFERVKERYGIAIKLIESADDIAGVRYNGYAFLLGVDSKWIDSVIERISNPSLHVVVLFGETVKYKSDVSSVNFDQRSMIIKAIEMLRKKRRYKTAFFGVQENDTSDADKASAFAFQSSTDNIYPTKGDIEECFTRFYGRISEYDSVICANDIIAVYLCKRCRECGIDIPGQLHVIGNGGLWIANNVSPRLTTVVYDLESMTDIAISAINGIVRVANVSTFSIKIKMRIIDRESTRGVYKQESYDDFDYPQYRILYSDNGEITDENINKIKNIDSAFSAFSDIDRRIVRELVDVGRYEDIAGRLFMTVDTIRYHIKKIYKALDVHSAEELRNIIDSYQIKI